MRSKKAIINTMGVVIELLVATVTSFIVPHCIIHAYGSSVNGLVSSIAQFLSYITLVESGIGAVGRAGLYRPLANGDTALLSGNLKALEDFYRKVAFFFVGYVGILLFLFPLLVKTDFGWVYTAVLIVIIAFHSFLQYYFGITNQTLIQADQKKCIVSLLHAFTLFLNMVFTIVLVKMGAGIHVVKIGSAIVFAVRPIVLYLYVRRHYEIDRHAKPRREILKQRWDGLAQHIAFFIHKNTDIAVLTILTNVKEVSVYSVYALAVAGCSKVVNIFSASLEPAFGNMIANGEMENLKRRVALCSTITVQATVVLFSTAVIIISPFVQIYTRGVTDVNYLRVPFGVVMLIAEAFYCIRLPYHYAIFAAGHFRQTRNAAIVEASMNIVISVILVFHYGLIGVAIGTLLSMLYRTVQYIWYYHARLLADSRGLIFEGRRLLFSLLQIAIFFLVKSQVPRMQINDYAEWFAFSLGVGTVCASIAIVFSYFCYREQWDDLVHIARTILKTGRETPKNTLAG